jgi:anti-anti-sigma regulatory factor
LENFKKIFVDRVLVIEVNLTRATMNEAIAFRKILEEEINFFHTNLVIDLSKCDYIDSTFFGAIVMTAKMLSNIGSRLKVVKPANEGESISIYQNTTKIFDKYKTREDAIKSSEGDI